MKTKLSLIISSFMALTMLMLVAVPTPKLLKALTANKAAQVSDTTDFSSLPVASSSDRAHVFDAPPSLSIDRLDSRLLNQGVVTPTIPHRSSAMGYTDGPDTRPSNIRTDWETDQLDRSDSSAIPGGLPRASSAFGGNTTLTPHSELAMDQRFPSIAVDTAGNAFVVWEDNRNGNSDIYFAMRPAGGPWGANVKVNDVSVGGRTRPSIAVDSSGNAYAVWQDTRNGNADIYFAMRPAGGTWGINIKVNDDTGTAGQSRPAIAVDSSGNTFAVWEDSRNGNVDIYSAKRPSGGAWGINIKVNDDISTAWQSDPRIAVNGSGNAYAVWTDNRNGNSDIYFAMRPTSGTWSANIKVNDDAGTASQSWPSIAADSSGNAYAVWMDYRDGNSDIYFAMRPDSGAWSANVKVNDDPNAGGVGPSIAVDNGGNAYALWEDGRNYGMDFYFAFRPAGGAWSANVKVNDVTVKPDGFQFSLTIAADSSGNAYAVWQDLRNGTYDIYFALRPVNGSWSANTRINDDAGMVSQRSPALAVDSSGNAFAVWEDYRHGYVNPDIYFAFQAAGGTWGTNVKVNDDAGAASQRYPSIAVDDSGNAYAIWQDLRNGNSNADIYFAMRPAGGTWGSDVKVNDDVGTSWQGLPSIAVDRSGNAYAVWQDFRSGSPDIYFAMRPAGGAWGANVKVNDNTGTADRGESSIAVDGSGNVYVVWCDRRNGTDDVYFAFRPAGGSWSTNIKVNDNATSAWQSSPAIAVDGNGNAYAVWQDTRNGDDDPDIYFAFRPTGGNWGTNVRVNDDINTEYPYQESPAIAVDGSGTAYAVWRDNREGIDVYFATRPAGGSWGANAKVNDSAGMAWQDRPAIAVNRNRNAFVAWEDARYGGLYGSAGTIYSAQLTNWTLMYYIDEGWTDKSRLRHGYALGVTDQNMVTLGHGMSNAIPN